MKKTGKTVKKYTALYRSALLRAGMHDAAQKRRTTPQGSRTCMRRRLIGSMTATRPCGCR